MWCFLILYWLALWHELGRFNRFLPIEWHEKLRCCRWLPLHSTIIFVKICQPVQKSNFGGKEYTQTHIHTDTHTHTHTQTHIHTDTHTHRHTYVRRNRLVANSQAYLFYLRKTSSQTEIRQPIAVHSSSYCTSRCATARYTTGSFIISPTNRHDRRKCLTDLGFSFRQISVAKVR
jgi:hypothetical protein